KAPKTDAALARTRSGETLATGLKQASAVLQWTQGSPMSLNLPALNEALRASRNKPGLGSAAAKSAKTERADSRKPPKPEDEKPQETLLRELTRAARGAAQIAGGAVRANREVTAILTDPVGRRALDHLLINTQTVHDNPELSKSFAAYITPDGHKARIDV